VEQEVEAFRDNVSQIFDAIPSMQSDLDTAIDHI
jgi:hypothetical protein